MSVYLRTRLPEAFHQQLATQEWLDQLTADLEALVAPRQASYDAVLTAPRLSPRDLGPNSIHKYVFIVSLTRRTPASCALQERYRFKLHYLPQGRRFKIKEQAFRYRWKARLTEVEPILKSDAGPFDVSDADVLRFISKTEAYHYGIVPLSFCDPYLRVALDDPQVLLQPPPPNPRIYSPIPPCWDAVRRAGILLDPVWRGPEEIQRLLRVAYGPASWVRDSWANVGSYPNGTITDARPAMAPLQPGELRVWMFRRSSYLARPHLCAEIHSGDLQLFELPAKGPACVTTRKLSAATLEELGQQLNAAEQAWEGMMAEAKLKQLGYEPRDLKQSYSANWCLETAEHRYWFSRPTWGTLHELCLRVLQLAGVKFEHSLSEAYWA